MRTTDPILMWGNLALLVMAIGFNIFAIYYGVKTSWTKEPLGPAVLALFGFLAATLDYFFVVTWFGSFPGRYVIRAALLTLAAGAVFWHLGWLVYVQRKNESGTVEQGGQDAHSQEVDGSLGGSVANDRRTRYGPRRDVVDGSGREDRGP